MTSRLVVAGLACLVLSGCALYRPSAGNPNGDTYLGSRSSTYEANVNRQQTVGRVAYDPSAPLPEVAPAPEATPTPAPESTMTPPSMVRPPPRRSR